MEQCLGSSNGLQSQFGSMEWRSWEIFLFFCEFWFRKGMIEDCGSRICYGTIGDEGILWVGFMEEDWVLDGAGYGPRLVKKE